MRVLICGDRNWSDWNAIRRRVSELPSDAIIIHGAARGADSIAGSVAESMGYQVEAYPAQWDKYGRSAGPIRNRQMLDTGIDLVIAFHGNIEASKGTKDCVHEALLRFVQTEVISGRYGEKI